MLYYKNNQWNICSEKVKYNQHGKEIEQYVGSEGEQWWVDFEEKWEHTEIIEFIDVVVSEEQFTRLEEINTLNIPDGHGEILGDYVIRNKFPSKVSHLLKDLENRKNRELDTEYFVDLDFRMSMSEMGL